MTQLTADEVLDERIETLAWELEDASFECGRQGGDDLNAIRKDNVRYFIEGATKAITSHFVEKRELAELRARREAISQIEEVYCADENILLDVLRKSLSELNATIKAKETPNAE